MGCLTNAGERRIRKYIQDNPSHALYIAWGYCALSETAASTDTALVKEYGRAAATVSVTTDALTVSISEVIDTARNISEVGIFDAASGGNMLYRGLLSEDHATPKARWAEDKDTLSVSIVFDFAAGEFTT